MSDLDTIRDRVDIVELIGETVHLQRSGRTYKGLCPFHSERTPSFIVNPERRTWHCFGACSTGGDVFSFAMRRDNLDFGEALRALAQRAGVELSGHGSGEDKGQTDRLIQANETAAGFFHNALINSREIGAPALTYAQQRGLDAEAIRAFEIGYAPESWDALSDYLRGRDFSAAELLVAGLLVEGERGSHDRFRNRLMFPIRDERGRVVGFGGRALGDGQPKYLNSPQSPVFDKGSLLYALDRAHDAVRRADRAVIVEGYLDAIAAHQHGYENVVATLGTALTERQIALVKRYSRRVALALDADAAGVEAALRGEQLIRDLGDGERQEIVVDWGNLVRVQSRAPVEVRVFSVPSGKDPDEAIRADPTAWPGWVEAALPPFEFRLRYELSHIDRGNARERLLMLDRMLPLLLEIGDRAQQTQCLSQLATAAGVREDDVRLRLNAALPAAKRGQPVSLRERIRRQVPVAQAATPGARTENFCLALLLRFPVLREMGMQLSADAFVQTPNRLLFEIWEHEGAIDDQSVPEELREQWDLLQAIRLVAGVNADPSAAFDDCLRRMALRRLEDQKRLLTARIVEQRETADRIAGTEQGAALLTRVSADMLAAPDPKNVEQPDAGVAEQMLADVAIGRHLHSLEQELRVRREPAGAAAAVALDEADEVVLEVADGDPIDAGSLTEDGQSDSEER